MQGDLRIKGILTMDMVEKVARALFRQDQAWMPKHVRRREFDELDGATGLHAKYMALARAAIEAMREPTFEMEKALRRVVEAGIPEAKVPPQFANRDSDVLYDHWVTMRAWQAMISAALSEPKEG